MPHPLKKFIPIADAITQLFGSHVDVAIHDILQDKIYYISGEHSQQKAGMPSHLGLSEQPESFTSEVLGPYEKLADKGQTVRSISSVLRNEQEHPIGLFCINVDNNQYREAYQLLEGLLTPTPVETKPEVLFQNDWRDRVNHEFQQFLAQYHIIPKRLSATQRREFLALVDSKGLLYARHSVELITDLLQTSRSTLYKDLSHIRAHQIG